MVRVDLDVKMSSIFLAIFSDAAAWMADDAILLAHSTTRDELHHSMKVLDDQMEHGSTDSESMVSIAFERDKLPKILSVVKSSLENLSEEDALTIHNRKKGDLISIVSQVEKITLAHIQETS